MTTSLPYLDDKSFNVFNNVLSSTPSAKSINTHPGYLWQNLSAILQMQSRIKELK